VFPSENYELLVHHDWSLQNKFRFVFSGEIAHIFKAITTSLEFSERGISFAAPNGLRVQSVGNHISVTSTAWQPIHPLQRAVQHLQNRSDLQIHRSERRFFPIHRYSTCDSIYLSGHKFTKQDILNDRNICIQFHGSMNATNLTLQIVESWKQTAANP